MKKITFAIAVSITIYSCQPAATFDAPQPEGVNSISSFPSSLHGTYITADSLSKLTINDTMITYNYGYQEKLLKINLDSSFLIVGDTLLDKNNGEKTRIDIAGYTIVRHIYGVDTVFHFSATQVAKKYKGSIFLNSEIEKGKWEVRQLSLGKNILTMSEIATAEDIQKLRTIVDADTTIHHFSPTKKQFKHFMKHDGFGTKEVFYRMKM